MRIIYMKCDLVCEYSLLALILRAIPTAQSPLSGFLDDCVTAARDALNMHEQCMKEVRGCYNDPFMVEKYISWCVDQIFQQQFSS